MRIIVSMGHFCDTYILYIFVIHKNVFFIKVLQGAFYVIMRRHHCTNVLYRQKTFFFENGHLFYLVLISLLISPESMISKHTIHYTYPQIPHLNTLPLHSFNKTIYLDQIHTFHSHLYFLSFGLPLVIFTVSAKFLKVFPSSTLYYAQLHYSHKNSTQQQILKINWITDIRTSC